MPLEIRSTQIQEHAAGKSTVEIRISDSDDAEHCSESILLSVRIDHNHPYFRGLQTDAIKRAQKILEEMTELVRKATKAEQA